MGWGLIFALAVPLGESQNRPMTSPLPSAPSALFSSFSLALPAKQSASKCVHTCLRLKLFSHSVTKSSFFFAFKEGFVLTHPFTNAIVPRTNTEQGFTVRGDNLRVPNVPEYFVFKLCLLIPQLFRFLASLCHA